MYKVGVGLDAWAGVSGGGSGAAYRPPVEAPRTFADRPPQLRKARQYKALWGVLSAFSFAAIDSLLKIARKRIS